MSAVVRTCRNPTCKVAVEGACAEGQTPPESCPWFGEGAPFPSAESAASDGGDEGDDPDYLDLPKGHALGPPGLDIFMRAQPIRLVAVIGDKDSGKTTLICSFYEALLKGELPKWCCFSARTIVAFEQKVHHSRAASGLEEPDTIHTSLAEGLHFFHLGLCAKSDPLATRFNLMISDRNGEAFEGVRNTPGIATQVREVVKADRVLIVLDGKKIAMPGTRSLAMSETRKLIRALIQGGALGSHSDLQIILTKDDLIQALPDVEAVDRQIAEFIDRQMTEFASSVRRLTFWRTVARNPTSKARVGIEKLLEDWLATAEVTVARSPVSGPRRSQGDRLLDRVSLEHLP